MRAERKLDMTTLASICLLAVAGVIPPDVNPWKDAGHPIPQFVLDRKSPMGPRNTKEMYRELAAKFPVPYEKLVWPTEKVLEKTKNARTVHVKDFGWDEKDATAIFEKAFRTPAKVVVVDKMSAPWRVTSVSPGNDRVVVFEAGATILGTTESQLANSREPLIDLKGCRNVCLVGKGDNYVGRYTEKEQEGRNRNREYGGNGLGVDCAENIAVKGITFARNGCDGACIGGDRRPSHNIWFEDCVFSHNSRQGVSIVSADGVYFRRCRFEFTNALAPKCGLDVEPWLPACNATANIYLFDCEFEGNTGGDLALSTASYWPVTIFLKRCHFLSNDPPSLMITQRATYPGHHTDAPSDIIFENCAFEGRRGVTPIHFYGGNFFYITFRGGGVVEHDGRRASVPPMKFHLNREYRVEADDSPVELPVLEGALVFDNFKIKGYRDVDRLLEIEETVKQCTVNSVHGTLVHNGKKKDAARFRYPGEPKETKGQRQK